ncbi:MAG: BlaI/MecI/CopY family transcriptional regulator [Calditrichaeota bacterium]|nr:BlaI/MecI/CopY family transcriptional regulator [Calditrichota bacterium]
MAGSKKDKLSKREQQIMDIIYEQGECSANEIHKSLPDPPSYSAVRAMLKILEDKKIVRHKQDGLKYVYYPAVSREKAKKSALKNVLKTFFDGSAENAVAALLDMNKSDMKEEDFDRMSDLIKNAKNRGK